MSKIHIDRYAYKVPILFEGDRGSGKTFDVREFARMEKARYMEIAGHESVEAIDFLGHPMQSEHGIVWKDGKLSQAFRCARDGHDTVLLIDEMLRIPQRHLSVLLSALSPDSEGNYRLQTGRMVGVVDGVGVEEEIVVPTSKLAIFATTNVGPEFAIDDLDPAIAERFIIVRKDTEKAQLTKILQTKATSKSFNKLVAVRLVELFDKTRRMVDTGTLNRHATTRTLSRALEHAIDEADVKQVLKDQILLWVDRDSSGRPVAEQVKQITRAIDELFPDAPPEPKAAKAAKAKKSAPPSPAVAHAAAAFKSGSVTKAAMIKMLMASGLGGTGGGSLVDALAEIEEITGMEIGAGKAAMSKEAPVSCAMACTAGGADKVYNLTMEKISGTKDWTVVGHWGKRGAAILKETVALEAGTHAEAQAKFDKIRAEKLGKGYVETASTARKLSV